MQSLGRKGLITRLSLQQLKLAPGHRALRYASSFQSLTVDACSILVVWQLRFSTPIWILECICHVYVLASKDRIGAHEVLMGMEMGFSQLSEWKWVKYNCTSIIIGNHIFHFIMLFDRLRTILTVA